MEITTNQYKRCDVVKVDGRVDSATAPELEETMNKITSAGRYNIVINMQEVDFMSSRGWWVLVETQKKCKQLQRGELVLANVKDDIKDTLDMVGMSTYFEIFDDTTSAVGYF
jgi:anti-sigma B factor antagonist